MKVNLLTYTPLPDLLVGQAAALCTGSEDFLASGKGAMASGHLSVSEHASMTFLIEDVSRVLLAQLTRHRIASFSVQSQRYCGVQLEYVTPPKIIEDGWRSDYETHMERSFNLYQQMVENGVPEEDARYIIPQGISCKLMMTMNIRELLHFFSLRCCNRAQWEIRDLADEMLRQCREAAPILFRKAGPGCVTGTCPEGKRSCGKSRKGEL